MIRTQLLAAIVLLGVTPMPAYADVALLLAQPYGRSGALNPAGHIGVYLSRVCAATPTVLRRCQAGEAGVVISRYNRVGDFDWVAVALIPYLYAVEQAVDVPAFASRDTVHALRDSYRRAHLREVAPDSPTGASPVGHWTQLVGAVYDRQIIAFSVRTTAAQDDELIAEFNAGENRRRFNILFRNCADFARDLINRYYPRAIRSSFIADLGFTTPKQIAKGLARYGAQRPELQLSGYLIPQIPGSRPDSGRARGVIESFVKTKKYAVPLTIVEPWVPVGLAAVYLVTGRFNPHQFALQSYQPNDIEAQARLAADEPAEGSVE